MSAILAIDLGGTRLRAGRSDIADPGRVETLGDWPAPASRAEFIELLRARLRETGAERLGIGVPGLAVGTTCRWVPNLSYLDELDLGAALPGIEVGLGNDAQLALLAEAREGAAAGLSDAILLAVGTGIGSAVLAGGRIVAGGAGAACSFGWAAADMHDAGDERSGWLERQASGRALDAAARRIGLANGLALVEAARGGEATALAALQGPMTALGTALAGAVALLDPQAVILAGGVADAVDVLEPLILAALRRHLPPHLRGIGLRAGRFGPRAGLVGASFAGAGGPDWRTRNG